MASFAMSFTIPSGNHSVSLTSFDFEPRDTTRN
eukprot:CAMPEP_0198715902 /NCGR_PEP_ID=MMETSP1471-20131121/34457_1 /TAXON_ID=41880 /ORGANISM="Pycnococcus provasolii, Strain RCC733" /LENGTH=32 /DNA_ID= /DNA_START= /DNA_END= /DNA_ORIENTATION=